MMQWQIANSQRQNSTRFVLHFIWFDFGHLFVVWFGRFLLTDVIQKPDVADQRRFTRSMIPATNN